MKRARPWLVGLSLLAGCDGAFSAGGVATVTPMFAVITPRDLRGLGAGESLAVELDGAYPTVFEFDSRNGPLDFDRIQLTPPGGEAVSMHIWLARQAHTHDVDLAGLPSARFRLANDASAAELGLMRAEEVEPRSCTSIDVLEIDEVVAVLFVADGDC